VPGSKFMSCRTASKPPASRQASAAAGLRATTELMPLSSSSSDNALATRSWSSTTSRRAIAGGDGSPITPREASGAPAGSDAAGRERRREPRGAPGRHDGRGQADQPEQEDSRDRQ